MIAVSDTTPLRHLIAIGQENLLHELFTTLLIPRGVQQELTDARTPDRVRRRVSAISWIEVRIVTESQNEPFPSTSRFRHAGRIGARRTDGAPKRFSSTLKDLKQSGFFITSSLEELLLRRSLLSPLDLGITTKKAFRR
jgi:predicted nucleic acid-binding protein